MSNQEQRTKPDGGASVSTAGLCVWTKPRIDASQAAYWVNAGYDDYAVKGLEDPSDDHGRYSKGELILARAGFELARQGFKRIELETPNEKLTGAERPG